MIPMNFIVSYNENGLLWEILLYYATHACQYFVNQDYAIAVLIAVLTTINTMLNHATFYLTTLDKPFEISSCACSAIGFPKGRQVWLPLTFILAENIIKLQLFYIVVDISFIGE